MRCDHRDVHGRRHDATGVALRGKSLTITGQRGTYESPLADLATATDTQIGYSQTLVSSDGTGPVTWTISSGALPAGLVLRA